MKRRGTAVHGRVVAITGGARGIGMATAAALHQLGARVAIGDIDEAAAEETATPVEPGAQHAADARR